MTRTKKTVAVNITFVYYSRMTNFALFHVNWMHGGFCEACANQLLNLKVRCSICRENIKGFTDLSVMYQSNRHNFSHNINFLLFHKFHGI